MNILGIKRVGQLQALQARMGELEKENSKLRALIDVDDPETVFGRAEKNTGNSYRTYGAAVRELAKKYEGTADWGVVQTGSIIDVRAAFIIGQGVQVAPTEWGKGTDGEKVEPPELGFARDFLSFNDIDREMAQEFAKEAEIEGRFLGQLIWDEEASLPSVRFRSWAKDDYKVVTDPNDYAWYKEIAWSDKTGPHTLEEAEFVYARFGGRVHQPDLPYPKVAKCLDQIECLDKALKDWSEICRLFASPVPDMQYGDARQAEAASKIKINLKLKKFFHHVGAFSFKGPDTAGAQMIEQLIITLSKMISGTTGVPVHFLGLPDLMSNRATAENLMELVYASTQKERQIWKGVYLELLQKAMAMWNEKTKKTPLEPERIRVDIPFVTQAQWDRIERVFLPAYVSSAISLEYFLQQIPGCDAEVELERKAATETQAIEKYKKDPGADAMDQGV